MLSGLSPRRLWFLVAIIGSAVILAVGWFFLVSPQRADASNSQNQLVDTQAQAAVGRTKLRALQADNTRLNSYKNQLATLQRALPKSPSTAQFVTDMQRISSLAGVTVTSISVTPPTTTSSATGENTSDGVAALPIIVAATGSTVELEDFLAKLQTSEARALVVGQVTESVPEGTDADASAASSDKSRPTINISMTAFVAS